MKVLRRKLTLLRMAGCALALLCASAYSAAQAQVNVIAATGGGAISADSVGGAWTALTGPELDETSNGGNGSFGTGTIVLNAPAGFEFNSAATVTVSIGLVSGSGSGGNQIDLFGGRGNPVSAAVTATTITVRVRRTSRSSTHNSLTWSGIQLRPTAHCALSSGDITESGSSSFALSSPNLGTLSEVIGATRMYTVLPGQSFAACSGVSGTPASQLTGVAFNLVSLVVADQWGNVDSGYSGSKTISYSGPTGTNSYTTSVAFSAGVSTTTLATTINTTQTTTISATDGSVAGVASSSFTVSAPLLHYAMDEGAWTGAAGEVADDSGNGYNGTATNGAATASVSPAIAGSPGTCGYGAFARASRNYVALPASFPNLTGSFTVAAWIRTTDNSQSGQRVMIDDQSNTQGWGFSLGDGGAGRLRFFSRGTPSALILDTPSVIANNTWYFVAAVADVGAKTKYIYVFSQAGALLSQVSAAWTEASFGSDAGPASIGGETNASGENSTAFYFSGNIDELRVYQSAFDSAQLLAVEQLTHPCASFTHYAINLPGGSTGLTCEPSQVRIAAHDSGHAGVAPAAGTVLNLSTSSGAGVWVAGLVSGTGSWTPSGLNNGQATYTWPGGETNFTVRLRQNTPATLSVNLLDNGGRNEASTEDPSLTFADTAIRVTDAGGTAVATLGTQISGKPSNTGFGAQTRYLQAMRTDTNTGACTTVFQNQTVSVGLAGARLNPTGGASQLSVLNSGGSMQAVATGAGAPGAYTNVSLAFDAQSKAPLVVSYPDAGSVQLYASYALPAPPAATTMTGSSNAFVVRPFGLRVSGVTTAASPSPASPVFAKAGASFNATVTAVAWKAGDDANADGVPDSDAQIASNAATPNFDAVATLSHSLNAPAGGNAGTLGGSTSFSGFSAGAKTQPVNWDEVGFIDLHAQSTSYLGSGQNVTNSSAGLTGVGRFIPDHFTLSGGVLTNRAAAACAPASGFSYLGEGIRLQYSLTANSASGAVTQNYTTASGYAKLPKAPAQREPGLEHGLRRGERRDRPQLAARPRQRGEPDLERGRGERRLHARGRAREPGQPRRPVRRGENRRRAGGRGRRGAGWRGVEHGRRQQRAQRPSAGRREHPAQVRPPRAGQRARAGRGDGAGADRGRVLERRDLRDQQPGQLHPDPAQRDRPRRLRGHARARRGQLQDLRGAERSGLRRRGRDADARRAGGRRERQRAPDAEPGHGGERELLQRRGKRGDSRLGRGAALPAGALERPAEPGRDRQYHV